MSFLKALPVKVLSRSFATAASSASVQVPVILHGIDGRYATALYTAAAKKNAIDTVEADLKRIRAAIEKDSKLATFLETPVVDRDNKKAGVKKMLAGGRYSELTTNFFTLLAENGRLDQTNKIMSAFEQLLSAHRGETLITVTSAQPLDNKVVNQLKNMLSKSSLVEKNQKITMVNKVDAQIMGGLIVEVGEKTIDLSVSSKINKLNRLISEAI
ncbi:ATP synthase F0 subcomplex subunit OSCP atp5 [Quaeritorhiza haematococci]|nr:ATP synthase F0 subcomplex subunit OSCP atp5 [Quaeritorhiza haematococci]